MEGILFDNHRVQIDKRSVMVGGSWQGKFLNGMPTAWEMDTIRFFYYRTLEYEHPVILDIGANTGSFCLLAKINKDIKVYAFEPVPQTYEILTSNIRKNNIEDRITAFPIALAEKKKTGIIKYPKLNRQSGLACLGNPKRFNEWEEIPVQVNTLDNIADEIGIGRVDLIKIDTEGCELFVLKGAENLIRKYKPAILAEYCRPNTREFGYDPEEIAVLLQSWGYDSSMVSKDDMFFFSTGKSNTLPPLVDAATEKEVICRNDKRKIENFDDHGERNTYSPDVTLSTRNRKTDLSTKGKEKLKSCLARVGWPEKEILYNRHFEWILDLNQVKSPKASVVVISWRFDPETLENFQSLDAQRDQDFELIFVNNGAPEDEFRDLMPYIDVYVKLNKNTGDCLARNIGAIFAKAPVIIFLDDDGIPGADFVKAHLEAFDTYDIIAARGVCNPKTDNPRNRFAGHYYLGDKPFPRFCDLEGNVSYLSEIFFKAGGWDDEIFFGHGGVILSLKLMEVEPDMRKQIYLPGAVIDHDYAGDDNHLYEKRKKQDQSRKHLLAKYPDLDDFLKSWTRFQKKEDLIPKRKYTISIVIVTYNRSHWISEAIQSALDQTSPAHEILIVDDGSTDNTEEIARSFSDKRIRYIKNNKNQGRPFARNIGVKEAEGEYILWLDDDDILIPEALERYIAILRRHPDCNLIYGKLQYFDDASGKEIHVLDPMDHSDRKGSLLQSLTDGCTIPNPGTLVKKSLFHRVGYYDEDFSRAQDYEFWTRAAKFAKPVKADDIVCRYRIHDRNISYGNFIDRSYESIIIRKLLERHPAKDLIPGAKAVRNKETMASVYRSISKKLFRYNDYYNARKYIEYIEYDMFTENDLKVLLTCDLYMGNIDRLNDQLTSFLPPDQRYLDVITRFKTTMKKYCDSVDKIKRKFIGNDRNRIKKILAEITDLHGVTFDMMTVWGDLMQRAGRKDNAFQFYKKALSCNPESDDAFRAAMVAATNEKERNEVKRIRDRLLYKEALFDVTNKEQPAAGEQKQKAGSGRGEMRRQDENALAIMEEATVIGHKGQSNRAEKMFLKSIGLSPGNKKIYFAFAAMLINGRQYNAALGVLKEVPCDDDDPKKLELTGYCLEGLNQDDDAGEYTDKLIGLDRASGAALNLKGMLARKKGRDREAEDYFLKAIAADKNYGMAYSNLGVLRLAGDNKDEALDLLEKGFILSPINHDVLTVYHTAAVALGTFERAEKIFREKLTLIPYHKMIHYQLIDLLLRQQKYEQAMDEIEKAIVEYGADEGLITAALDVRKRLGPKTIKGASKKKGTVSLCMIVKNEEQYIAKCLMNLRPLANEMIVVDTGSSDRTKALSEIFGAKVYNFKWNDDFSKARNDSLSKAQGDWILVMDADEIISPRDYKAFKKVIRKKSSKAVAYSFVTRNYHVRTDLIGINPNKETYKDEEKGYGWISSEKVRLFKNRAHIRFEYPVHEKVEPFLRRKGIRIKECAIPVHHYGKLNKTEEARKGDEYFRMGVKKLEKTQHDPMAVFELAVQAGQLEKWEEAIELWQRHNRLCPHVPAAHVNIGTAYQKIGRLDRAVQSAKRAMEMDPDMNEAPNNYALYKIHEGHAKCAIPILENLAKKDPEYLPGRFKLAVAYCCVGRKEDGLKEFKRLSQTSIGPGLADACQSVARELVSLQQHNYAKSVLWAATEIAAMSPLCRDMQDRGSQNNLRPKMSVPNF